MASSGSNIQYHGKVGDLFIIYLKYVIFSTLTLGIYYFWGEAQKRRYLWSQTSFAGERLEYTGRGMETFKSFMLFALAIIGIFIVLFFLFSMFLSVEIAPVVASYLITFSLLLLLPVGQYFALRYRLTRTSWRGVRGNLTGSAWRYMGRYWGSGILSVLTLGLMTPRLSTWLAIYPLSQTKLGNTPLEVTAKPGDAPYKSYILYYLFSIVFGVLVYFMIFAGMIMAFEIMAASGDPFAPSPQDIYAMLPPILGDLFFTAEGAVSYSTIMTLYILVLLVLPIITVFSCWWRAQMFRFLAGNLTLAGGQFRSDLTAPKLFRLVALNFLITVFSLGLLYPWTLHRTMRYIHGSLGYGPTEGLEDLVQNSDPRPSYGEGLAEFAG